MGQDGRQESEEEEEEQGPQPEAAHDSASQDGETTAATPSKRKRRDPNEARVLLSELPSSSLYEVSYMHRAAVVDCAFTATDFLVSASDDGVVKLWKKSASSTHADDADSHRCVQFVKRFLYARAAMLL